MNNIQLAQLALLAGTNVITFLLASAYISKRALKMGYMVGVIEEQKFMTKTLHRVFKDNKEEMMQMVADEYKKLDLESKEDAKEV